MRLKTVILGKTYQFKADNWSEESDATTAIAELSQIQKIANIPYTNTLRVAVLRGDTSAEGAYLNSAAKVELVMTIPDANNKGGQEDIAYAGEIFRDNSKIQEYLYAVTNVVGYYTVAMTPWNVAVEDGIPSGNGFITITIGNDGKAKVAGQLPDGSTKPTYTAPIAFAEDGSVYVQVYFVRSPACFGGVIRMFKNEDGIYVVDGGSELIWNNDKAELSYYGDGGWQIAFALTGGYFDKLINLQRYYLTSALSVLTADIHEFPSELLSTGYSFETSVYPSGIPVNILGDVFSTDKKVMVKEDGLYNLPLCINPCNVQVKVARATGIVSGSFSVWSVNGDTAAQKEVTGFKHNGVIIMNRDAASVLDDSVASAGYFFKSISVSEYGAGGSPRQHGDALTRNPPLGDLHTEEYQAHVHADDYRDLATDPRIWGSFVWCMFDFGSDCRLEGERWGLNDKGLVTYDRRTRKDAWYLYHANWSAEPTLRLVGSRRTMTTNEMPFIYFQF